MKSVTIFVVATVLVSVYGCQPQRSLIAPATQEATSAVSQVANGNVPADLQAAMFDAAEKGHAASAVALLSRGADINAARPNDNNTALHIAAQCGHAAMVEMLVEKGANISARNAVGMTPLMAAASGGHRMSVEVLLRAGADPIARSEDGLTALDLARQKGHGEVVRLLGEYQER